MTPDLKALAGEPKLLFKNSRSGWEQTDVIEAPYMLKRKGVYYLTYSASPCCNHAASYGIGYATSSSPMGPFTKYSKNPILYKTSQIFSPGKGTFFATKNGNMCVSYSVSRLPDKSSFDRDSYVDRAWFEPVAGAPDKLVIKGPTKGSQPVP